MPSHSRRRAAPFAITAVAGVVAIVTSAAYAAPQGTKIQVGYRGGEFSLKLNGEAWGDSTIRANKGTSVSFRVEPVSTLLFSVTIKDEKQPLYGGDFGPFAALEALTRTELTAAVNGVWGPVAAAEATKDPFDGAYVAFAEKVKSLQDGSEAATQLAVDLRKLILRCETLGVPDANDPAKWLKGEAQKATGGAFAGVEDIAAEGKARAKAVDDAWAGLTRAYGNLGTPTQAQTALYTLAKTAYTALSANQKALIDSYRKAGELMGLIRGASFAAVGKAFSARSGKVEYTVTVTPRTDVVPDNPYKGGTYTVVVETVGGVEVDTSTGIFFTGLTDRSYEWSTSASKWERGGPEDDFSPSFGVLLHAYENTGKSTQLAASVGLALDTNKHLQFLLGPSFMLRGDRRLIVTAGVALGQVQVLNSADSTSGALALEGVERFRPFVGVSWNLD